jgi:exonuclease SbcC
MITSVRLRGFRRYDDETLVLGPGLNFVEGDNNAGKTTILYAIEYALFGRVDGFKNQGAFVAPNAKGMGVELVFVGRDGGRYRLQRAHLRPPRSKTKLEGHFTLKRLGATAEDPEVYVLSSDFQDREEHLALKLQALTGLTRRLFGIAVHMRQGEIARILEGAPELDIVLGVTAAVVADDELRALALESEKKAAALPVAVETARRVTLERTSLSERREAAEANIAELRADFAAIEGELAQVRDALAEQRLLEVTLKTLSAADDAARDAKRRLDDHHERAASIRSKGSRDDVNTKLATIELRQQAIDDERVRVRREIAAADDERRELDRQRGDLAGRIARRERLPSGAGATCETCGAAIDTAHHAKEVAAWREELATIDARLAAIASVTTLSQAAARAFDKEERELAVTRAEGTRQLSDLAELDAASAKLEAAAASTVAAFIAAAQAADVDAARQARTDLAGRVAELARTNIERNARVEAERRSLSTRVNQAESDVANLGAKIAELDRELATANATIAELQTHARKAERLRKLAAAFKELQLSLRADASASLAASAHTLHAALGTLDGVTPEFDKVTVDPTRYSVQVVPKHLGEEVPAALYEGGGHRLLLGLAMKLAVSKLIGRVPFVMLDEPTYGLDGAHRTQLLERIAGLDVADQIVLITHDVDLQSVGINRVRVVRDGEHSRIRTRQPEGSV